MVILRVIFWHLGRNGLHLKNQDGSLPSPKGPLSDWPLPFLNFVLPATLQWKPPNLISAHIKDILKPRWRGRLPPHAASGAVRRKSLQALKPAPEIHLSCKLHIIEILKHPSIPAGQRGVLLILLDMRIEPRQQWCIWLQKTNAKFPFLRVITCNRPAICRTDGLAW